MIVAASAALLVAGAGSAAAQLGRGDRGQAAQGPQSVDCAKIASMPNAPMTLEACLKMVGSAASIQRSMNDPAGMRPGDEAMTCDQIKGELMASGGVPMNRTHVAQAQSAATDLQTRQAQVQKEGQALAAQESATNAAASSLAAVPYAGKAAQAAADAKNTAEQNAFNTQAQKKLAPSERALSGSTATLTSDMAANLQNDPRKARLISLAGKKDCR
jgi:hypothetical protein